MSWSIYLTDIDPATLEEAAAKEYTDFTGRYHDMDEVFPAMEEQFKTAVDAARSLLPTVGEGNVNVTLSGHANPGHRPRAGYANDLVTVSVSSAAPKE